jgi:hypothetical protein
LPWLLETKVALREDEWPLALAEGVSEALRLLNYGRIGLTREFDEIRELTHGFIAPPDACECYGELLDVLVGIRMEVASEVRMERGMPSPPTQELVERVRHAVAHPRTAARVM